jgi:hypothetical protein
VCAIFRNHKQTDILRSFGKCVYVRVPSCPETFIKHALAITNLLLQLEERPDMGPGYHVEGPINAIYTEILLSRLCQDDTDVWPSSVSCDMLRGIRNLTGVAGVDVMKSCSTVRSPSAALRSTAVVIAWNDTSSQSSATSSCSSC